MVYNGLHLFHFNMAAFSWFLYIFINHLESMLGLRLYVQFCHCLCYGNDGSINDDDNDDDDDDNDVDDDDNDGEDDNGDCHCYGNVRGSVDDS